MDMRIEKMVEELHMRWLGVGDRIKYLRELTQNKAFNNKKNRGYAGRMEIITARIEAVRNQILSLLEFNDEITGLAQSYNCSKLLPPEGMPLPLHSIKIAIKADDKDPFHPKIKNISIED